MPFASSIFIIAACAIILAATPVRAVDSITDRSALIDVYHAMGGAQWTSRGGWLAPNVSMCSWFGVVCQPGCPSGTSSSGASVECRVVELDLASNNLRGAIAPALQLLANLTRLKLGGNPLSGTIPSFSALKRLHWLDVNSASLTGSIPDFQALVSLERLELYGNHLTGTLPSFAGLPRLLYFDVEPCFGLVGPIPSFPPSIDTIYLGQNLLNGTIPNLASLVNLTIFWAHLNLLTGTMPGFETLVQLRELFLSDNQFTGTVPAYPALVRLELLSLSNNKLTGTMPSYASLDNWI
jgi:Leucine-rich repeat (LRR) protein